MMDTDTKLIERLAYSVANAKLGERSTMRCEGPTDYDIDLARGWVRRVLRAQAASGLAGVVGERDAKQAVADARLCLARLLDYAVLHCPELTDESPLAVSALKAIAGLDESFEHTTDMATGLTLHRALSPHPEGQPKQEGSE